MLFAFASLLLFGISQIPNNVYSYPWHASCRINWVINAPCDSVKTKLIDQMNAWTGDENCGQVSDSCPDMPCGQNCLYEYKGTDEDGTVRAKHLTPVKRYVDSLSFEFEESGSSCKVSGFSRSDLWYAILDFGTNYCNLRNLMDGSGLSASNNFSEETSDSVCTQYTSRDCSRY